MLFLNLHSLNMESCPSQHGRCVDVASLPSHSTGGGVDQPIVTRTRYSLANHRTGGGIFFWQCFIIWPRVGAVEWPGFNSFVFTIFIRKLINILKCGCVAEELGRKRLLCERFLRRWESVTRHIRCLFDVIANLDSYLEANANANSWYKIYGTVFFCTLTFFSRICKYIYIFFKILPKVSTGWLCDIYCPWLIITLLNINNTVKAN